MFETALSEILEPDGDLELAAVSLSLSVSLVRSLTLFFCLHNFPTNIFPIFVSSFVREQWE